MMITGQANPYCGEKSVLLRYIIMKERINMRKMRSGRSARILPGFTLFLLIMCACSKAPETGSETAIPVAEDNATSETDKTEKEAVISINDVEDPQPQEEEEVTPVLDKEESESDEISAKAEAILSEMTLEEKVYQMMILRPEQLTGVERVTAAGDTTRESLKKYPVGGIIYFAENLMDPEQTKEMLKNTQEYAMDIEGLPLFLCVDEEGGRVARIGKNPAFGTDTVPPMKQIASKEEAHEAGSTIGKYLKDLGFNVDFAPDSDVLTNPDNEVIGNRSFGSDAEMVKEYSRAYSDGLHENGILSTYKHFPGHGATTGDTHEGFAYTDKTLDELKDAELVPFADAQEAGADMIMVSHISVPKILDDNTPCSISHHMITDILKEEMGYEGIIVTDSMNMGAITEKNSAVDAALMAIEAGNDLLLAPNSFESLPDKLAAEIDKGSITEARIDESVRKIIIKKLSLMH